MEKLLKIGEVSKALGITAQTLRRWNKQGKLKARRTPGNRYRYLASEIDAWLTNISNKLKEPNE